MSIIIKGMKIPKNCIECPMQFGGMCYVQPPEIDESRVAESVEEASKGKPSWCPLIDLPPHGRLIDADELIQSLHLLIEKNLEQVRIFRDLHDDLHRIDMNIKIEEDACCIDRILVAPTIIEAETCNNSKETCNKTADDAVIANIEAEGE